MTVQLRNVLTGLGLVGAIALTQGASAAADLGTKRAELRKMCDDALATLFKEKPAGRAVIGSGYSLKVVVVGQVCRKDDQTSIALGASLPTPAMLASGDNTGGFTTIAGPDIR